MNERTDQQLLRDYAEHRSEPAFGELVKRHVDLVHSAAQRMVRDAHLAEDVTQGVFVALAREARRLVERPVISGWLHRTTQNLAANVVRSDVRRRAREQEAAAMNELLANESDATWENIAPHLDDALGALGEADRDALMLRYFERKSAQEMAQVLGVSTEAAQKRVTRAVERLREFFAERGVTVGVSGLAAIIGTNAVHAAPVGLAFTISTAAALAGTTLVTTTTAAAKTIAMTTLQKTFVATAIAAALTTAIYQTHQASQRHDKLRMLQPQQAAAVEQMEQLRRERDDAINRLASLNGGADPAKGDPAELLRLRGELGVLRGKFSTLESDYRKLVSESIHGLIRPRADWSDKGNQDPFATVETMLWATSQGNKSRVADVATFEALAETRWQIFPSEHPPVQTVGAVNLIHSSQNQTHTQAIVTAFVREDFIAPPGGTPYSVNKLQGWRLKKSEEGWKISEVLLFALGSE